ncbi:MAG: hypothetical protein Q7U98_04005 [Methylicorpusculum sp.]|uniref:hypothetical protein n=1 Tax=Methylicorpusculum sp. TaxID=2713644 RepID=UPI0027179E21|nr:hypothetical protein [Methylicorpusculum sp.]MDO8938302.1 hypothetical protein [Methylicorpusculum sp.]MDP2200619.1 hypothetical protein [Methylicorpusculum sp.]
MKELNYPYRSEEAEGKFNDTVSNPFDFEDQELERCLHKKGGKMDSGLGNFREKIKKGRKSSLADHPGRPKR